MNNRSSFRRSQTFQPTNYSAQANVRSDPPPPRRSLSIEFPTSPDQSLFGDQMYHFTHPHHPIALVSLQDPFTCSGCKERGAGKRFACQQCDFQLHDFCALSPPALKAHPLHVQHQLVFHSKPKTGAIRWPTCNVCGKSTRGFTFRCNFCHFQMHPCCAMLSDQINYASLHNHPLNLLPPLASDDQYNLICRECNRKRSGRLYGCRVCNYHLHAVCAKDLINGLKVNGIRNSEKASMLGPAVRFASQAVAEFFSGLIDGIGEGVGEALQDCSHCFLAALCIWNGKTKQKSNHDDSTVRNPSALFYHLFKRHLQIYTESKRTSFQKTSKKVESKMRG